MRKFEGLSHYENTLVNRHIDAMVEEATSSRLLFEAGINVDLELFEHHNNGELDLMLVRDLQVTKRLKLEKESSNEK